mmetsp:Transcript_26979/g.62143  ORF Transcript_26979/g.62143 Transcript_26979/m.62143 type:complete len:210 (-) Transcript_26979:1181-1810(-)
MLRMACCVATAMAWRRHTCLRGLTCLCQPRRPPTPRLSRSCPRRKRKRKGATATARRSKTWHTHSFASPPVRTTSWSPATKTLAASSATVGSASSTRLASTQCPAASTSASRRRHAVWRTALPAQHTAPSAALRASRRTSPREPSRLPAGTTAVSTQRCERLPRTRAMPWPPRGARSSQSSSTTSSRRSRTLCGEQASALTTRASRWRT